MESLLLEWLSINSLLLFGIGVLAAIIGVMFGAAGLVLLPAMLLIGIPIHTTVAVNKFATGLSSFSTVVVLTLKKKVQILKMLSLMFVACLGGVSGAFLATRLMEKTLNIIACIVLIIMFFLVLKNNKNGLVKKEEHTEENDIKNKGSLIAPFLIGIYDGGMGPGSALLNITYFLKKRFSYVKAAEMTRFMMFSSCMSAFLFYFFYGIVNWGIAIPITAGSIVGSHIGLKIIPYVKTRWIQVIFPVIFLLLIAQVVSDIVF
ncbi:sulfite exporter TauE/SafE family protein [Calidifontibacillus erzurumensis]|uniref:Probable membrane transporter protein n=1 Tax=Calidifontibacillus erzurumensis TaxID=2741433 RepID=A0A8J8KDA9_9BACI|nr:sulfite exporter TauE/SafE family protein [Calidifontibacillus erzurumensis]NSL52838.1 sulfite exporter TauE/SafE family protein [Calidifontibacillus erzurumensis]